MLDAELVREHRVRVARRVDRHHAPLRERVEPDHARRRAAEALESAGLPIEVPRVPGRLDRIIGRSRRARILQRRRDRSIQRVLRRHLLAVLDRQQLKAQVVGIAAQSTHSMTPATM
jgi:hypothetical protein